MSVYILSEQVTSGAVTVIGAYSELAQAQSHEARNPKGKPYYPGFYDGFDILEIEVGGKITGFWELRRGVWTKLSYYNGVLL